MSLVHVAAERAQLCVGSPANIAQVFHGLRLAALVPLLLRPLLLTRPTRAALGVPPPHVVAERTLEGEGHATEGAGVDLGPSTLFLRRQRPHAGRLFRVLPRHVVVQGQHGGEGQPTSTAHLPSGLEGPPHAAAPSLFVALEGVHGRQSLPAQFTHEVPLGLHPLVLVCHMLLEGMHSAVRAAAQLTQDPLQFEVHATHVFRQLALYGK